MSIRIPMLFIRLYPCTLENGLRSNTDRHTIDGPSLPARLSYVVLLPKYNAWKQYNSQWMRDEYLITDHRTGHSIFQHDVDIVADEDKYVFDLDDPNESFRQALAKMQELWAGLTLPVIDVPVTVPELLEDDDMSGKM